MSRAHSRKAFQQVAAFTRLGLKPRERTTACTAPTFLPSHAPHARFGVLTSPLMDVHALFSSCALCVRRLRCREAGAGGARRHRPLLHALALRRGRRLASPVQPDQ
eukprot:4865394-Pleurochrysis_carterae.AAC.1